MRHSSVLYLGWQVRLRSSWIRGRTGTGQARLQAPFSSKGRLAPSCSAGVDLATSRLLLGAARARLLKAVSGGCPESSELGLAHQELLRSWFWWNLELGSVTSASGENPRGKGCPPSCPAGNPGTGSTVVEHLVTLGGEREEKRLWLVAKAIHQAPRRVPLRAAPLLDQKCSLSKELTISTTSAGKPLLLFLPFPRGGFTLVPRQKKPQKSWPMWTLFHTCTYSMLPVPGSLECTVISCPQSYCHFHPENPTSPSSVENISHTIPQTLISHPPNKKR